MTAYFLVGIVVFIHTMFIYLYCDVINQEKLKVAHENEQLKQEVTRLEEAIQTLGERAPLPSLVISASPPIPRA